MHFIRPELRSSPPDICQIGRFMSRLRTPYGQDIPRAWPLSLDQHVVRAERQRRTEEQGVDYGSRAWMRQLPCGNCGSTFEKMAVVGAVHG
jgi:hypothetical protein